MMTDDEKYVARMAEYRSLARDFTNLTIGAMLLPTFYLREILGVEDGTPLVHLFWDNLFLPIAYIAFLVGVVGGVAYQYVATKYIIDRNGKARRYPRLFFRMMISGGCVGLIAFVIGALVGSMGVNPLT